MARLATICCLLVCTQEADSHSSKIQDWVDSIMPPLHDAQQMRAPGSTPFDKVAEALQQQFPHLHIGPGSLLHLPRIQYEYVEMHDGVKLFTIVVNPWPHDKPKGACLVRSPYGSLGAQNVALLFLIRNGFAAVMQADRGFYRSGGEFDLWRGAADDGQATLKWITKQSWSNGHVYSVGGSADGLAAVAEVFDRPSALRGGWLIWTSTDGHGFAYPGGAFRLDMLTGYMDYMSGPSRNATWDVALPALKSHESYGPWWYNLTACRSVTDLHADPPCRLKNVHWPVVMNMGWWDIFQVTTLESWFKLRAVSSKSVRDEHVLFVAPLGHCVAGISGTSPVEGTTLRIAEAESLVMGAFVAREFFNGTTRGRLRQQIGRVNIHVMGSFAAFGSRVPGSFWTSHDEFPEYPKTRIYLSAAGVVSWVPVPKQSSSCFEYDPNDPTPLVGGDNLPGLPGRAGQEICGSANQDSRDRRRDVLVFDSEPLDDDSAVMGHVNAHLFVTSTAKDTDFAVTLADVALNGTSMLVRYGLQRMRWRERDTEPSPPLQKSKVYSVNVSMGSIGYIFPKGHRMRVTVSSAAAPYYNPTSNTGVNDLIIEATPVVAQNCVHSGGDQASHLFLPLGSASKFSASERWPCRKGICGEMFLPSTETVVI
eukprot:TRINITY_DN57820_c0_g1_i1.p1 TRINITY_DN57820_c0_g1~~TRINITY_DN57820_c0_g1_i1.p1  ORF type:complete len:650 (-),score=29.22 TRINITY_DN57820_c0_g1_i1:366-2315(-)